MEDEAAELDGGRDEESKSWGIREIADEFVDEDNNDGLRLDDVGDGGGEGFGREVIIFVAGRRSLLAWDFFPLSNTPRRRIAPTGTSTYSNVAIVDAQKTNGTATEKSGLDFLGPAHSMSVHQIGSFGNMFGRDACNFETCQT